MVSTNPKKVFSECMEELISDGAVDAGDWYDSARCDGVHIHDTAIINCKIDTAITKN